REHTGRGAGALEVRRTSHKSARKTLACDTFCAELTWCARIPSTQRSTKPNAGLILRKTDRGCKTNMRFLTPGEVAKRAGGDSDTVRSWHRRGKLTAQRTESGRRLFSEREVERFLGERQRVRDES